MRGSVSSHKTGNNFHAVQLVIPFVHTAIHRMVIEKFSKLLFLPKLR